MSKLSYKLPVSTFNINALKTYQHGIVLGNDPGTGKVYFKIGVYAAYDGRDYISLKEGDSEDEIMLTKDSSTLERTVKRNYSVTEYISFISEKVRPTLRGKVGTHTVHANKLPENVTGFDVILTEHSNMYNPVRCCYEWINITLLHSSGSHLIIWHEDPNNTIRVYLCEMRMDNMFRKFFSEITKQWLITE